VAGAGGGRGHRPDGGVAVFVAAADEVVLGCYRLSVLRVEGGGEPALRGGSEEVVPDILMSHLGVDHHWQRQGLGSSLVLHAVEVFAQPTAQTDARLLVANAGTDSEQFTAFSRRFGFQPLDSAPGRSYLVGVDVLATLAARR